MNWIKETGHFNLHSFYLCDLNKNRTNILKNSTLNHKLLRLNSDLIAPKYHQPERNLIK